MPHDLALLRADQALGYRYVIHEGLNSCASSSLGSRYTWTWYALCYGGYALAAA